MNISHAFAVVINLRYGMESTTPTDDFVVGFFPVSDKNVGFFPVSEKNTGASVLALVSSIPAKTRSRAEVVIDKNLIFAKPSER